MSAKQSNILVIFTTAPQAEAAEIAKALIERRLIACASLIPAVNSLYFWEGQLNQAQECQMILKTCTSNLKKLEAALAELHPYECPEFIALEPKYCSSTYLNWVNDYCS